MIGLLLFLQLNVIQKPLPHTFPRDTTRNYIVVHNDGENMGANATKLYLRWRGTSYHYFIDRNGKVYQFMDLAYVAKHAGISKWNKITDWNLFSIGVCLQGKDNMEYTQQQKESFSLLVKQIYKRYPDSKDKPILKHSQVAYPRGRKSDPGIYFKLPR